MKKRSEIEEKYKWDLSDYFVTDEAWDKEFERIKPMYEDLTKFEGKLSSDDALLACLKLDNKLGEIVGKLSVYISLKCKEDGKNAFYQNKSNTLEKYLADVSPRLAYITSEINEIPDERLEKLANDKRFADFNLTFKHAIRNKPHMLSKVEEKLLATLGECIGGAGDVFDMLDAVDIKFEDAVDSKGVKHPLNNSNYSVYSQSDDASLRESAFKNVNGGYGKYNYTIAANYLNNIKTNATYAKVRRFDSSFEEALFGEEVDGKVYTTLLEQVNKNTSVFQRYYELKRQALGLKKFGNYDVNAKLKTRAEKVYTYDQAFDKVLDVTKVLGDDYVDVLKQAKEDRWIDVMPNENKDTGAFSWGSYGAHPVVMMNFEGTTNCVFTLAHELGHMMHTYYSNKANPQTKAGYEIFVAEVASTVNEMLLAKTMLKNASTKEEKLYYIDYLMNMFYGTVYRQTMFAEFEYNMHKAYESGGEVTAEAMNNEYSRLTQKYFGKDVKLADELKYEWSRIPHFYNSFYVYKYATGLISALAISNKILAGEKDAVKNYRNFLASGCTKPPVELLKGAGADLTDEQTFANAFEFVSSVLDDFDKLLHSKKELPMRNFVMYDGYWWEYDPNDSLKSATLINPMGGRNSFCDIRFCKTAIAKDRTELDWSGTCVYDNKKYLSGWLSPKGKFYGCDYRNHENLAEYVLHKETYELEKEGYIKVNYEYGKNNSKKYYIIMGEKTIPTNAQIKYLYDTFGNDEETWQEMLWRIRVKKISEDRRQKAEKDKNK